MTETSTTSTDDQATGAAAADSTTSTDTNVGPDNQPANKGDNLDETSKSTDTTSDDGDKTSTDDKSANTDDKSSEDDAPASTLDADLGDWAAKRGMPAATTDEQKQAYQDLRDSQREFSRRKQAEKDSENSVELDQATKDLKKELSPDSDEDDDDDEDPLAKKVAELEADRNAERTTRLQSEFYSSNKVTDAEHKAILDIIKDKVTRPATTEGKLQAHSLWTHPSALPDLLELAKARIANSTDPDTAAEAARQEERERIAKESQIGRAHV